MQFQGRHLHSLRLPEFYGRACIRLLGLPYQGTADWMAVNHRRVFSQSRKLQVQDQSVGRVGLPRGLPSCLAEGRLVCVLPLHARVRVLIASPKAPVLLDEGTATQRASFNLNCFPKGPVSKYCRLGLGLRHKCLGAQSSVQCCSHSCAGSGLQPLKGTRAGISRAPVSASVIHQWKSRELKSM